MKVLIVEDDSAIAANLYDYLTSQGYDVDLATNGPAGLRFAVTQTLDAILLDLSLPGMDGLSLCRELREQAHRDTPVLMLTARDTLDDKLAGFDHGADDYLVKPFSLKEVGARLEALIKRYRGRVVARQLRFEDVRLDISTLTVLRSSRTLRPVANASVRSQSTSSGSAVAITSSCSDADRGTTWNRRAHRSGTRLTAWALARLRSASGNRNRRASDWRSALGGAGIGARVVMHTRCDECRDVHHPTILMRCKFPLSRHHERSEGPRRLPRCSTALRGSARTRD